MHSYTICGLSVGSELSLPGLIARSPGLELPDVTIRSGSVPTTLDDAHLSGPTWEIASERFLLRIPGIACFLLVGGREIVFEAESGANTGDIPIFLLGSVLGILLHQRGQIVLHASATSVNGRAMVFCGSSGSGKSTLAAALSQRGFACVTDDVCAISLTGQDVPMVHPDGRQLKLWAQAIKQLQLAECSGSRVRTTLEKYYVEHGGMVIAALPLGAVYALREARPPLRAGIEQPNIVDCARLIRMSAYRPLMAARMGQRDRYFHAAVTIANTAGVYNLTRTIDFAALPASIALLEQHWSTIGLNERGAESSASTAA